jgi:hypothetical protein
VIRWRLLFGLAGGRLVGMTEIALLFGVSVLTIGCLSLITRLDVLLFKSRFAFSLRTLMIAFTLSCFVAACVGWVNRAGMVQPKRLAPRFGGR